MLTNDRIKQIAHDIGFDACGITNLADKTEGEKHLNDWISSGKHAGMKYLTDFAARKNNFLSRFPDAKSVIVLGVNYYSANRESGVANRNTVDANGQLSSCHPGGSRDPEIYLDSAIPTEWCQMTKRPSAARPTGDFRRNDEIKNKYLSTDDARFTNHGARLSAGRIARYAWGKDYHRVIGEKLKILKQALLSEYGGGQIWFELCIDTKPFLERELARNAGLGFIGKQSQLISLEFGPWLFLAELLTNLELPADQPHQGSCGTCRVCIDRCPTGAISGNGAIDARKCISYLTIEHKGEIPEAFHSKIGNRVFGCDECLNVCPYTAKAKEGRWPELKAPAGKGPEISLHQLEGLRTNKDYEVFFKDTAILRASKKQFLRNAKIVLSNLSSLPSHRHPEPAEGG